TEVIPSIAERKDLNIERGETLKHELGLTKQKIVATIAALVPHKDPMTMVETIKELSGLRNDFVFLHFGDGHLNREVMKKLKQYNLEDVYKLMGFYENVEDFFSIFDVFVMGSHEEGLGSSVLDAFLYRVPVVSTDAGGLKEAVSGRGLLCPVKYPKCLAESINTIIENKVLREKFIIKAFNDVNEYYSMKRNIEEYIKIFNSLLK
ncbi:MAG TPA: glycosyltransferase family 1 protein, partial [Nitrospiraceae bacterium]|nr:glycosyltransferase family 1 protein [Nitrospiraceae bacterium]